ncbi:MAG: hypothetical protein ABEH78_04050 [Haloferacaceae archaeon]
MGILDKLLPSGATEYECNDCGNEFEKMFRPEQKPTCPDCDSLNVDEA